MQQDAVHQEDRKIRKESHWLLLLKGLREVLQRTSKSLGAYPEGEDRNSAAPALHQLSILVVLLQTQRPREVEELSAEGQTLRLKSQHVS